MKVLTLTVACTLSEPAWSHHSPPHVDIVCTVSDAMPGVVLVPFLLLAAIGIVRAVRRHRQDR